MNTSNYRFSSRQRVEREKLQWLAQIAYSTSANQLAKEDKKSKKESK